MTKETKRMVCVGSLQLQNMDNQRLGLFLHRTHNFMVKINLSLGC